MEEEEPPGAGQGLGLWRDAACTRDAGLGCWEARRGPSTPLSSFPPVSCQGLPVVDPTRHPLVQYRNLVNIAFQGHPPGTHSRADCESRAGGGGEANGKQRKQRAPLRNNDGKFVSVSSVDHISHLGGLSSLTKALTIAFPLF